MPAYAVYILWFLGGCLYSSLALVALYKFDRFLARQDENSTNRFARLIFFIEKLFHKHHLLHKLFRFFHKSYWFWFSVRGLVCILIGWEFKGMDAGLTMMGGYFLWPCLTRWAKGLWGLIKHGR